MLSLTLGLLCVALPVLGFPAPPASNLAKDVKESWILGNGSSVSRTSKDPGKSAAWSERRQEMGIGEWIALKGVGTVEHLENSDGLWEENKIDILKGSGSTGKMTNWAPPQPKGDVASVHGMQLGSATRKRVQDSAMGLEHGAECLRRNLPAAIIIGVRKGGTRALLEMLNLHPGVAVADNEVHFFDDDHNFARGLDWYREQMPMSHPKQITVEKTPAYFTSSIAPERIYRMDPGMRLLLIVRDPTERLISDYTQVFHNRVAQGKATAPFEEVAIRESQVNLEYRAVHRSMYDEHLKRWLTFFPRSHLHVVDGERLVHNPPAEVAAAEHFLGLPGHVGPDSFYFNTSRGFFCLRNTTHERCLSESKGRPHPPVRWDVLQLLRDFFREHNDRFFQMVGQTFDWA
uniref:heparan sulfate glucosamine 3-O-sulfotransferase 1-like n=1 Tax=Myxine glutinosa TaxID=7769 RepID=UPI00358EA433